MTTKRKTIIVTGASQGIAAAVANLFLERDYNVVGNSRTSNLALVDGDIGLPATAETIVATAVQQFGSVDGLVNNAGIILVKPFTEHTPEDFRSGSSMFVEDMPYGGIGASGMGAYRDEAGFRTFLHPPYGEPFRQFLAAAIAG